MNEHDYDPRVFPLEHSLPSAVVRVAVVQLSGVDGDVEENIAHAVGMAREAARAHRPDILLLPEAFTCPGIGADQLLAAPRPVDGVPYQTLRDLARELHCYVGGGFLALRGDHVRSTYVLAEPDGSTHLHDKDQPSIWTGGFSAPGQDDGFTATTLGPIGVALGEEWLRYRTALRLRKAVRLIVGGAGSWSTPSLPVVGRTRSSELNRAVARNAAAGLARVVGTPAAIAQQVGRPMRRTGAAGIPWDVARVGESQIVAADGTILARLRAEDGEGHVSAEVELTEAVPHDGLPESHWLIERPASVRAATLTQYLAGRMGYKRRHRAGAFPWQPTVSERDLHPYNPPYDLVAPELRRERQFVIPTTAEEVA